MCMNVVGDELEEICQTESTVSTVSMVSMHGGGGGAGIHLMFTWSHVLFPF